jgi:hypothetical protein
MNFLEEYVQGVRSYMEQATTIIDELRETLNKSIDLTKNCFELIKKERETNGKLKSIIERLAPEECQTYRDSEGDNYCSFCNGDDNLGITHSCDCPWVEARKLLEELK